MLRVVALGYKGEALVPHGGFSFPHGRPNQRHKTEAPLKGQPCYGRAVLCGPSDYLKLHRVFSSYDPIPASARGDQFH